MRKLASSVLRFFRRCFSAAACTVAATGGALLGAVLVGIHPDIPGPWTFGAGWLGFVVFLYADLFKVRTRTQVYGRVQRLHLK